MGAVVITARVMFLFVEWTTGTRIRSKRGFGMTMPDLLGNERKFIVGTTQLFSW